MSIKEARVKESEILKNHPYLEEIDDSKKGIKNLCKFLIRL